MSENDKFEEIIGSFGRYQIWILVVILFAHVPADFQLYNVVFVLPNVDYVCLDIEASNATNYCPCHTPEYDRTAIFESATSEWNLICGRTFLASLAQSLLLAGMLIGSLFFGYISDRFGRKIAVILAVFSQPVFGTTNGVAIGYWMFAICRFFTGCSLGGTYVSCYVLIMELSGKSFRPYLSGLHELAPVMSYTILPLIAYFLRDWRHLQLVTSSPWLIVIVYFWILPESPRWLITVGRRNEAVDILKHIARKNNRLTDNVDALVDEIEQELKREDKEQHGSYIDLFKTPKIRKHTIINGLMWMCCSHAYFGISQYIGRLNGNIYLNVFINGLFLIVSLVIMVVCNVFLKRKIVTVIYFSISGTSILAFILTPVGYQSISNGFAILAQVTSYNAFILLYLYTTEVFPTIVRNSAMGFASMCARVGGLVAPFVVNIGIEWVSMTIISILAFSAALLCCMLPETKDIVLMNSIEQAEEPTNQVHKKENIINFKENIHHKTPNSQTS